MMDDRRYWPRKGYIGMAGDDGRMLSWVRGIARACHLLDDQNRLVGVGVDADGCCLIDFKSSRSGGVG